MEEEQVINRNSGFTTIPRTNVKVIHPFRVGGQGYGLERNILSTLPGLADLGLEVVALAVNEERSGEPISTWFVDALEEANVKLVEVSVKGRLPFRLAVSFSEVFRRERPAIVHSHDYKTDLALLLSDAGDAVRMTTVHGWLSRSPIERGYEWLNVQACKRLDATVVFCEDYRRRLTDRGVPAASVLVIPVGHNPTGLPTTDADLRATWGFPDGATVVGQIGRLSDEKRPDLFIRVAEKLAPSFPEARFVLVGDGHMKGELTELTRSLGLTEQVLLAGYNPNMADVFSAIDIAVNSSSTESMPRSLLEAGSAGLPVVATAVGGSPEIVLDGVTGYVCEPDDQAGMEGRIGALIKDAGLRNELGGAARKHVHTVFSIESCSKRLAEAYQKLALQRGRGNGDG